jgi:hypothetical protein
MLLQAADTEEGQSDSYVRLQAPQVHKAALRSLQKAVCKGTNWLHPLETPMSVFVALCVGRGLATVYLPGQRVQQTVYRIKGLKAARPNKMAVEPQIIVTI